MDYYHMRNLLIMIIWLRYIFVAKIKQAVHIITTNYFSVWSFNDNDNKI